MCQRVFFSEMALQHSTGRECAAQMFRSKTCFRRTPECFVKQCTCMILIQQVQCQPILTSVSS